MSMDKIIYIGDSLLDKCDDGGPMDLGVMQIMQQTGFLPYLLCVDGNAVERWHGVQFANLIPTGLNDLRSAVAFLRGVYGPTGVVVQLGTNDTQNGDWCVRQMLAFQDFIAEVNMSVIFISPPYLLDETNKPNLQDIRNKMAAAGFTYYIDGSTLVPQIAASYTDGTHLSKAGHTAWATNVLAACAALGLV